MNPVLFLFMRSKEVPAGDLELDRKLSWKELLWMAPLALLYIGVPMWVATSIVLGNSL